jgi:site-specific DNA-methyltransferase (adenine-specific)
MQPYYADKLTTLYQGDCLAMMAELPAHSFDAVICDPPYGTTACAWDSPIPFTPMWAALKRLVKLRAPVVLFGSQPFTSALVMSNPRQFKYTWVWNKNNSAGFATAPHRPFIITEDICIFGDGAVNYYPQMTKGVYRTKGFGGSASACYGLHPIKGEQNDEYYPKNIIPITKINNENDQHPTQKPLALLEYLVKTYTHEGDTVLDFTCGSGTTLRACKNLGRLCVGIEQEERYCAVTARRLSPQFEDALPAEAVDDYGPLFAI